MIYDCFTFFNEFDLLKIRLMELTGCNDWVTHILVESNCTFTGKSKPLYFEERKKEFERHANIMHVVVDDMPNNGNPWDNEKWQRNRIKSILEFASPDRDDTIIISDADEVLRCAAVNQFKPSMGFTALVQDKFGYWLNCLEGSQTWGRPRIMPYSYIKDQSIEELRNKGYENKIENGGWHWSYLGGVDAIRNKFNSFSHTECNKPELNNEETLKYKIETGQSLWSNRPDDLWKFVEIDNTFPKYLTENINEFKHLIHANT